MMVSVFSKFPLLFVFGFSLFVSTPCLAQSRVNTKKLSEKLEKVAEQQNREAEELDKRADEIQKAIEAAQRVIRASEKRSEKIQRELSTIDREILELLGGMVAKIMGHEKIGPVIRKKPHLIFTIPEIKELIQINSSLKLVINELVKEYL